MAALSSTCFTLATALSLDGSGARAPWLSASPRALNRALEATGLHRIRSGAARRATSIELIDTFDWRIARAGRALVRENGNRWSWVRLSVPSAGNRGGGQREASPRNLDHHGASILNIDPCAYTFSPAERPRGMHRFPPTIERDSLPAAATARLGNRAALVIASATARVAEERVANRDEKQVGVLIRMSLADRQEEGETRALYRLVPLRGFGGHFAPIHSAPGIQSASLVATLASLGGRNLFDYGDRFAPPLDPGMTVAEAHEVVVPLLLDTMARNVDGVRTNVDPEFLHDFRVALRRLRTYLRAAASVPMDARGRIRSLWEPTGPVRDRDVFLERLPGIGTAANRATAASVEALRCALEAQRAEEFARLLPGIAEFARDPARLIAGVKPRDAGDRRESIGALAHRLVERADRQVYRASRRVVAAIRAGGVVDDDRIHALRIKAKRARYTRELFAQVGEADTSGPARDLRRVQKVLGDYNDVVSQSGFLAELISRNHVGEDARVGAAYVLAGLEWEREAARGAVLQRLRKDLI